jgi:hypothetical protein
VKRVILVAMSIAVICATGYVTQLTLRGERIADHSKQAESVTTAAQVKAFPPADQKKGADYMRTIIEADLLSLMCARATTNSS